MEAHNLCLLTVLVCIALFLQQQDKYFQSVCELDIMFNLEKTHFILDEMAYSSISSLTRVNTQCINCFRRPLEKERAAVAAAATR
eukprot:3868-Heterococcus_DN1.PRE.10